MTACGVIFGIIESVCGVLFHFLGRPTLISHHFLGISMQPASETKHVEQLPYDFGGHRFLLNQRDADGFTNGTTLWLGGQILSYYLASVLATGDDPHRKRAIELGSGIGLTALVLHSLGWNVCATDVEPVLSTVLKPNIMFNNQSTSSHLLECKELDWMVPPAEWTWDAPNSITGASAEDPTSSEPSFDLIVTADTLYISELVTPLLRSLHHLAKLSLAASSGKHSCPVYVSVERRDPQLMDRAFDECRTVWGFEVERVRATKIKKALERAGVVWVRDKSVWEGVEIWKMRLRRDT